EREQVLQLISEGRNKEQTDEHQDGSNCKQTKSNSRWQDSRLCSELNCKLAKSHYVIDLRNFPLTRLRGRDPRQPSHTSALLLPLFTGVTTGGSSAPLTHTAPPSSAGLPTQYVYVLTGVSVAFFLCLLLLVFLLLHRQHQRKHGPLSNKGEEQRPQERLSPAADIVERTPDIATVDKLPEKDTPSPAAGDTQEVTYAQLDHRALTLRAARAVSPQATEPTADSNTYAALARH
uniref:Uncharacterized protein n=1 Tax=Rhinolophus ferrumequinum TaxID=59479 RepID=A0A671EWP5_RHIFE